MQKWMTFHLGAFCVALRCREILARLVEADTTMENGSVRPIFEEMLINAYLWPTNQLEPISRDWLSMKRERATSPKSFRA